MLRSRIILGLRGKTLQQELIRSNYDFVKVLEACRTREQGNEQFRFGGGRSGFQ